MPSPTQYLSDTNGYSWEADQHFRVRIPHGEAEAGTIHSAEERQLEPWAYTYNVQSLQTYTLWCITIDI